MNALELMTKRCSIRRFTSQSVEEEKLNYILEAARVAPSAVNYQPWYFLIIQQKEGLDKIHECYPREWIREAPLVIAICGDHNQSWKRNIDGKDHLDIDAGIVTEHICLAATELGLGSCIVCHFDANMFSDKFGLPEEVESVVLIPIGYPAEADLFEKTPKRRKELEEMVRREHF